MGVGEGFACALLTFRLYTLPTLASNLYLTYVFLFYAFKRFSFCLTVAGFEPVSPAYVASMLSITPTI